jgi:hypothetical protein
MTIDPKRLSKLELQNLIDNHRNKGVTDTPLYIEALAELEKKQAHGLRFDKSMQLIRDAAKRREFLS